MRYLNFISMIPHMTSNILTMLLVFSLYVYLKRLQLHGSSLCVSLCLAVCLFISLSLSLFLSFS